jgi:hypothetical protein
MLSALHEALMRIRGVRTNRSSSSDATRYEWPSTMDSLSLPVPLDTEEKERSVCAPDHEVVPLPPRPRRNSPPIRIPKVSTTAAATTTNNNNNGNGINRGNDNRHTITRIHWRPSSAQEIIDTIFRTDNAREWSAVSSDSACFADPLDTDITAVHNMAPDFIVCARPIMVYKTTQCIGVRLVQYCTAMAIGSSWEVSATWTLTCVTTGEEGEAKGMEVDSHCTGYTKQLLAMTTCEPIRTFVLLLFACIDHSCFMSVRKHFDLATKSVLAPRVSSPDEPDWYVANGDVISKVPMNPPPSCACDIHTDVIDCLREKDEDNYVLVRRA